MVMLTLAQCGRPLNTEFPHRARHLFVFVTRVDSKALITKTDIYSTSAGASESFADQRPWKTNSNETFLPSVLLTEVNCVVFIAFGLNQNGKFELLLVRFGKTGVDFVRNSTGNWAGGQAVSRAAIDVCKFVNPYNLTFKIFKYHVAVH